MKKTVIATISALAVAGSAFAQGTVNWGSITPTYLTAGINNATYSSFVGTQAGQAIGGGGYTAMATAAYGYYFQLLYLVNGSQIAAPTTLAGLNAFTSSGAAETAVNNTTTAGRLTVVTTSTQAATPAGWNPSSPGPATSATIVIAGWSANLGNNYATVLNELNNWSSDYIANAYFGVTSSGYIQPNAVGSTGATLFGNATNPNGTPINSPNTPMYLLSPTPEPGTMALAALGGASLLLFRRRK